MEIFKHRDCNSVIVSAEYGSAKVTIPVKRDLSSVNGRTHQLESFWQPTPAELKLLASGHCVRMTRTVGFPIRLDVVPK